MAYIPYPPVQPAKSPLERLSLVGTDIRWQDGQPVSIEAGPGCYDLGVFGVSCPGDYGTGKFDTDQDITRYSQVEIFEIIARDECSVWSNLEESTWDKVYNALLAREPHTLEAVVFGGTGADIPFNLPNSLVNSATEITQAVDAPAIRAVSVIEHELRQRTDHVVIHIPAVLINYIHSIVRIDENGHFRTLLGSYVVAGSGYSGQPPGGGTLDGSGAWIYGTGRTALLKGDIAGSPDSSDFLDAATPMQNKVEWAAERRWGWWHDPCVPPVAVKSTFCSEA